MSLNDMNDYYVRPPNTTADQPGYLKRMRVKPKFHVIMITSCDDCGEMYEYPAYSYASDYRPHSCLDCLYGARQFLGSTKTTKKISMSKRNCNCAGWCYACKPRYVARYMRCQRCGRGVRGDRCGWCKWVAW